MAKAVASSVMLAFALVPSGSPKYLRKTYTYNVRKLHRPRMSDGFLTDIVDMTSATLYRLVVQQVQGQ